MLFIWNKRKDNSEDASYEYIDKDDFRIVNGYDSIQRPWIALLVFKEKNVDGICGGSLLNQR